MRALFALWLGLIATPLFGSEEPAWMAFGDIRGNVAPCGCDPLTDLGGIRRLSRFVQENRTHHPGIALFSLGENLPLKKEPEKAQAIQDTLQQLKPDALLWRGQETRSPSARRHSQSRNLKTRLAILPRYLWIGIAFWGLF